MSNGVKRRRKPAQKGVQAVFTPGSNWKSRARVALGLGAIGAGTAAWIYTTRSLGGFGLGSLIPWDPSLSAILLPISIPLLVGGAGLCTYYLATRRTWRASNRIQSALIEMEALVGQRNANSDTWLNPGIVQGRKISRRLRFDFLPKTLAIALAEAVIMVIIYGGLVQEYVSNVNMQNWVQTNFAPGIYLLNYYVVLILAGLLGMLIFRLLPRKLQPEQFEKLALPSKTNVRMDE